MSRSRNRKGFHRSANHHAKCPGDKFQMNKSRINQETDNSERNVWLLKTILTLTYPAALLIVGEMYKQIERFLSLKAKIILLGWSALSLFLLFSILYVIMIRIKEK